MNIRFALSLSTLALAAATSTTFAHGDEEHTQARRYDPAKVEATDFGQEGDPKKVIRTIQVDMADNMRFTPADVAVKRGETVKFVVRNDGKVLHEMVLGTKKAIAEHAALMKKFPEMEHADANMAHVKPGKAGEIVWQFTQAGEFQFACLQPGHFEAGMVGKVVVALAADGTMADGEVRKIDKAQGKITLRHGPIANLDMPGMTMVFKVADPKMLDSLNEGDKVKFSADRVNGVITVTAIQPAK
jgi:uncharacterized cupredoxin-like copper-binding protein